MTITIMAFRSYFEIIKLILDVSLCLVNLAKSLLGEDRVAAFSGYLHQRLVAIGDFLFKWLCEAKSGAMSRLTPNQTTGDQVNRDPSAHHTEDFDEEVEQKLLAADEVTIVPMDDSLVSIVTS